MSRGVEELLRAQEEVVRGLEHCCDAMEERLKRCIRRRKAELIHRMAVLARLGGEKGVFTPKRLTLETGIRYSLVYRDLRCLLRLGIIDKPWWGRYVLKAAAGEEALEDVIAGRMMRALVGERPRKGAWEDEEGERENTG